MAKRNAKHWIETLNLQAHPEGGFYFESFRSERKLDFAPLGSRNAATSIYFLIEEDRPSNFHRLRTEEVWYFHDGESVTICLIDRDGTAKEMHLGLDIAKGESPQLVVPANCWFGAKVRAGDENGNPAFSLVGCSMAPGFDFKDFEIGSRAPLLESYPQHKKLVEEFTSM